MEIFIILRISDLIDQIFTCRIFQVLWLMCFVLAAGGVINKGDVKSDVAGVNQILSV